MKRLVPAVLALVLWVAAAVGAELKVGTLNCYLLFDPAVQHPGKLDEKEKMTPKEYREKLGNLASRPNNLLKRVWTDHYFVGADLFTN